jgi:hypothetical protein
MPVGEAGTSGTGCASWSFGTTLAVDITLSLALGTMCGEGRAGALGPSCTPTGAGSSRNRASNGLSSTGGGEFCSSSRAKLASRIA